MDALSNRVSFTPRVSACLRKQSKCKTRSISWDLAWLCRLKSGLVSERSSRTCYRQLLNRLMKPGVNDNRNDQRYDIANRPSAAFKRNGGKQSEQEQKRQASLPAACVPQTPLTTATRCAISSSRAAPSQSFPTTLLRSTGSLVGNIMLRLPPLRSIRWRGEIKTAGRAVAVRFSRFSLQIS